MQYLMFGYANIYARTIESHSYSTGVTAALLWWHMSKLNVIFNTKQAEIQSSRYQLCRLRAVFWSYCRNREYNELGEPPPTPSHEWGVSSWGLVRQKQVSRTGTNNYISQVMWDVISCPCPWYLLRAHKSYIEEETPTEEKNHQWGIPYIW